jgi:tRNA threonylcarbamoyladenosine biosynthesis protein TsaE
MLPNWDATVLLGAAIGAVLQPGDVVAITGDLGAGKTTLAQAIAAGAGYTGVVTSPTYSLIHEYHGRVTIVHIDPYRLDEPEEMFELGLADYLDQPCALIVEWANRIERLLPADRLTVALSLESSSGDAGGVPAERRAVLSASEAGSLRLFDAAISAIEAGALDAHG